VNRLTLPAFAKINLCLEVLGKRSDGLHDVVTVLQTISLADWLQFRPREDTSDITLECDGMEVDDDNLILRAASLLRRRTGAQLGCGIYCEKNIPVAAGLGGGSADAAVTLRALNELWGTGLSERELADLGRQLGADVPFAVYGGSALATGSGGDLRRLPAAPPHWLVLVPTAAESERKTAEMYAALEPRHFSDGTAARRVGASVAAGDLAYEPMRSAFSDVAATRWPVVGRALAALSAGSARAATVSGAGPSVFALYEDRDDASRDAERLNEMNIAAGVYRFMDAASRVEADS
jgi:4-diphosphocytidyl-2-C-methyl-D-erythritol kinase